LDPWRIPTNLVHSALIGFTAVRGFQSLLASWKPWQNNQLGEAPNQAYFWAQEGMPSWHFMAAPSPDATNQIRKLSALVLKDVNPILETNKPKFGTFVSAPGGLGLAWHGIPWFSPHLSPAATGGMPFIFAGFSPVRSTNRPAPPELWPQIYGPSNLVYYDWELTGPCVDGMSQMAQMLRIVFDRARLTHSSGLVWLKALEPKLGNATSAIFQLSPTHLSFTRSSSVGFTDPELQVIMDWLESPSFPIGLHTFVAPPPPPMTHPRGGASVPASRRPGGASVPASSRGPGGASGGQAGASRSNPSGGTPIARPGFRPPPRIPTTRSGTNG
ncbi:MAG TPA: hypothetical protein VHH88_12640, partial [Verrucomicrobiae bacterium]|nr:hypothetical protein [Verrucomicrobiae bacterium]